VNWRPGAAAIAPRIAALKRRCEVAGVPAIYVNDNHGYWRSDFRQLVMLSTQKENGHGRRIAEALRPAPEDYSVLKPKHSAFFATPLDLLLRHLRVKSLILTGVATDQCVVMSATDARMRDYDVLVPEDCVAAQNEERNRRGLDYLREAQRIKTTLSGRIRLPAAQAAPVPIESAASRGPSCRTRTTRTRGRPRAKGRAGRPGTWLVGRRARRPSSAGRRPSSRCRPRLRRWASLRIR
jgi:nicotinamidase-related amidase